MEWPDAGLTAWEERLRRAEDELRARAARLDIGRAEGMLMERYDLSCAAAFAVLVRVSQESKRKLRDLAAEMVADAEARRT